MTTFHQSKLAWDEIAQEPHARMLALYREFLALRRDQRAFRPGTRSVWQVDELAAGIGAIRLQDANGDWMVVFDLVGGHEGEMDEKGIVHLAENKRWEVVISSNEVRFGGGGSLGVDLTRKMVSFGEPEVIVLRTADAG